MRLKYEIIIWLFGPILLAIADIGLAVFAEVKEAELTKKELKRAGDVTTGTGTDRSGGSGDLAVQTTSPISG